jgi:LysM repeat protein
MTAIATLTEMDAAARQAVGQPFTVDFNPQSLRLTHSVGGPAASQGVEASGAPRSGGARQVTGTSTSLSLDLVFDTTRDGSDVRQKTQVLVSLARPAAGASGGARVVRFSWGAFLFVGSIDQIGETIDLFSADGVPLRAAVSLSMRDTAAREVRPAGAGAGASLGASASIGASAGAGIGIGAGASAGIGASAGLGVGASASAGFGASAGVGVSASAGVAVGAGAGVAASAGVATVTVQSGDTIQAVAARAGVSWKALAAANGITDPRHVPAGVVLDLRVG